MSFITSPIFLAVLFIIILVGILLFQRDPISGAYKPKKTLLTKAETNFYRHLLGAISGRCIVFCTVRVADVVEVSFPQSKDRSKWQTLFNQISSKHFDYVLVDDDMNILCAIELNDKSHDRKERQERDAFLRKVMKSADIPLLEIKAARKYNIPELRGVIDQLVPSLAQSKSPISTSVMDSERKRAEIKPEFGNGDSLNSVSNEEENPLLAFETPSVLPIPAQEYERKSLADIHLEMERPSGKTPLQIAIEKSEKYQKLEQNRLSVDNSEADCSQSEPVVSKTTNYQTRDMRLGRE